MAWTFEQVAGPYGFTEGPVWDGGGVLFSDIPNDRIMRYDVASGETEVHVDGSGGANGLKLDAEGRLYGCQMVGRRVVRYDDDRVIAAEYRGSRLNSPNDLAIDSTGAVWFTDPDYAADWEADDKEVELDHYSVYRVDPEAGPDSIERVTHDTTQPNGILLSPDGTTLYVAQSDYDGPLELRAYPVVGDAEVGEYEVLHDFAPDRGIDGMCLDESGNIVATAGWEDGGPGPSVYVFAPDGEVLERHPSPDPQPTNCCFGGGDLRNLYLTGGDGCLYRARTDRTGYLAAP
ncbi:MAG: SMP-30/gluconolactonase/LRE family protein [Halobacteriales archaeon]